MCGFCDRRSFLAYTAAAFTSTVIGKEVGTQPPHRSELDRQFRTGGTGTHRNFYAGVRYMHLAAGMPDYEGNIFLIVV